MGAFLFSLSSCYKHYLITIGISRTLVDYYNIYPSIEVDITAVPASMADEIKTAGVESYFAPDSPLRAEAAPYTVRFSEEITAPVTLSYRQLGWQKWVKKKPDKLVLIVNLPYSADMKSADGRILAIDIKERVIQWEDIYFEIGPKQIAEVPQKPVDPRRAVSNLAPTNK
ncbi:hypothetical protein AGMMS49546_19590 [Spirochaetia bacterium]|nr:hypothetical protein AGMMS49546_19590 [Spirochaetia bacterium]